MHQQAISTHVPVSVKFSTKGSHILLMEIHCHSAARERSSTGREDMEVITTDREIDAERQRKKQGRVGVSRSYSKTQSYVLFLSASEVNTLWACIAVSCNIRHFSFTTSSLETAFSKRKGWKIGRRPTNSIKWIAFPNSKLPDLHENAVFHPLLSLWQQARK